MFLLSLSSSSAFFAKLFETFWNIFCLNTFVQLKRIETDKLQLFRLKQTEQTVDMETLCKAVERDWNGVAPFCRTNGMENLKETIHTSLGGLIKQRKIYYTGNKGYFRYFA